MDAVPSSEIGSLTRASFRPLAPAAAGMPGACAPEPALRRRTAIGRKPLGRRSPRNLLVWFECATYAPITHQVPRAPPYPFFAARAFPSGVRGPVARSHGRNSRISSDCRLRRPGVHPLHCLGPCLPNARQHSFITRLTHLGRKGSSERRTLITRFAVYSGCRLHIAVIRTLKAVRLSSHHPTFL